ncbi:MAG: phosphate ABC transporter ATP-binding protein [Firmicutes bacterium]|nr:phosphate ABC transporter ATP-binding protein [Bacillota bacterium]
MDQIIKIQQLSASYDGKPALKNITAEIPENRITAIIGPSGCGKSTLLRAINGLLWQEAGAAVSGSVLLCGTDTKTISPEELRRRIGLVFQTPSPFPFSIYKNLTYGPLYFGHPTKAQLQARAEEVLKATGLYEEVKNDMKKSALKLSGGQQQRLCIARALTVDPQVLLLDEPCSALDVKNTQIIEELLLQMKKDRTVVIVTHNIAQAQRIADKVLFLYEGSLLEEGSAEELFACPRHEKTKEFLSGRIG